MGGRILVGPAGWSYRDWAGIVYPKPKPKGFDPLVYLSRYFDAVEVNSTFYRPAPAEWAERWVDRVGDRPGFRFTAKLWKRFTHERGAAWTPDEVALARALPDALLEADRFGALLLQFPWSFRRTDENREWLDDLATTFGDLPLVLEVRHASWETPELFAELRDRGIGFVNVDQPLYDDSIAPSARATGRVGYVRVHGRNYRDWFRKAAEPHERYDYLYTADELEPWAARATEVADAGETLATYVVTNNHYRGKGIVNALMLRSMIDGRKVPAPPPLFDEYGEVLEGYAEPREG